MIRALLFAALCLTAACAEERPRLVVVADSTSFGRIPLLDPPMADVWFRVTNLAAPAGFVPSCGHQPVVAVEQAVSNGWTQYNGGYCITIYPESPLELKGGNWARGSVKIADPGRYRLRLDYATSASFDKTLAARSGPFEVR